MNASARILAIGLTLCAASASMGVHIANAQQPAENRTVLLTTDLKGIEGQEVRMWRTDIPPGVVGAKHYHPGTECIYVLDGALDLEKVGRDDGPPQGRRGALRTARNGADPAKCQHHGSVQELGGDDCAERPTTCCTREIVNERRPVAGVGKWGVVQSVRRCNDLRRHMLRAMSKKWRNTRCSPSSPRREGGMSYCDRQLPNPRRQAWKILNNRDGRQNPMRQMLIRSAILIAACGSAGSAYCAPLIFFGGFTAFKPTLSMVLSPEFLNSGHVIEQQQLDFNKTGGSGFPRQLGTSAGNAIAAGQIAVSSAPGVLAVYADAAATATNGGFSAAAAGAKTSAGATMIDEWTFDFGHPVKRTHVEAAFSLSADLTTTADGVNSTSPNERVDARAFADVRVSGDGISPNLAIGHTLDTFGLSEDAVLSQTINPHQRFPPPMTIPVSLDFEGNFVDVLWRLIVDAEATVRSDDVVNRHRAWRSLSPTLIVRLLGAGSSASPTPIPAS